MKFLREVVLPYDGDECLKWPFSRCDNGRCQISINGKMKLVHRLVCEHVNGPPPTPEHEAAHNCGKGHEGCVTKRHLRWATHIENSADKVSHGTAQIGEKHPMAKLTAEDVLEIRALRGSMLGKEIALAFGVAPTLVSSIQTRKIWKHLP